MNKVIIPYPRMLRYILACITTVIIIGVWMGQSWTQSLIGPLWLKLLSMDAIKRVLVFCIFTAVYFALALYPIMLLMRDMLRFLLRLCVQGIVGVVIMSAVASLSRRYIIKQTSPSPLLSQLDNFSNDMLLWYEDRFCFVSEGSEAHQIGNNMRRLTRIVFIGAIVILATFVLLLNQMINRGIESETVMKYGQMTLDWTQKFEAKLTENLDVETTPSFMGIEVKPEEDFLEFSGTVKYLFTTIVNGTPIYDREVPEDTGHPIAIISAEHDLDFEGEFVTDGQEQWIKVRTPLGGAGWVRLNEVKLVHQERAFGVEIFPQSVEASAYLSDEFGEFLPEYSVDRIPTTTWAVKNKNEWVEYIFQEKMKIQTIQIVNGFSESQDMYEWNSRIKKLRFSFSEGETFECELLDIYTTEGRHTVDFNKPVYASSVKIMIEDIYDGSQYSDIGLSEIAFFG